MNAEDLEDREKDLFARIQADERVEVFALVSGKRVMINIPLTLISSHNTLKKIRAKDPDTSRLTASVKEVTGGDTLYSISIYADGSGDEIVYYVADGHQRLKALSDYGAESTTAQVCLAWESIDEAMRVGFEVNVIRYDLSDEDIFSAIRNSKITDPQLMSSTGKSSTQIARYRVIAGNPLVARLVGEKALGFTRGHKLIDAANKNKDRLAALGAELTKIDKDAEDNVTKYKALKAQGNLAKKHYDKTTKAHWFKQSNNLLNDIESSLKSGDLKDGHLAVVSSSASKTAVVIGADVEWSEKIALFDFFGESIKDVPVSSFDTVLKEWESKIRPLIVKAREVAIRNEGASTPQTDSADVPPPIEQQPSPAVVDN